MEKDSPPGVLSMAAWWDPKSRKMIFNPFSQLVPGILAAGSGQITFVKPGAVIFDLPLLQVRFAWKGLPGTGRFSMNFDEREYVLYTVKPRYEDRLSPSDLEKVSEGFKLTSLGGQFLGTSVASFTDWLGTAGDLIEAFTMTGDMVTGTRNYRRLRRLADPAGAESSEGAP